VTDFGAVPGDDIDDAGAFRRAFAAGTRDLYVPAGTYVVSSFDVPDGCYVHGAGSDSVLVLAAGNGNIMRVGSDCHISTLAIDGTGSGHNYVEGLVVVTWCKRVKLDRLTIADSGLTGIVVDHGADVTISDCHIARVRRAIRVDHSSKIRITNNTITDCREHGITFSGNWRNRGPRLCRDLRITGNDMRRSGSVAIWGEGARRVTVRDNVLHAQDEAIHLESCEQGLVRGNGLVGAVKSAIVLLGCQKISVTGNRPHNRVLRRVTVEEGPGEPPTGSTSILGHGEEEPEIPCGACSGHGL
jgi:parallel beta-helix repeat protein